MSLKHVLVRNILATKLKWLKLKNHIVLPSRCLSIPTSSHPAESTTAMYVKESEGGPAIPIYRPSTIGNSKFSHTTKVGAQNEVPNVSNKLGYRVSNPIDIVPSNSNILSSHWCSIFFCIHNASTDDK